MPGSKRLRQQQARLAFTPLSSSSPAAKDYHQQVRDRAAAVRYASGSPSPSKRRKIQLNSLDHDDDDAFLPTPSTPALDKHGKRTKQQRLDLARFAASQIPSTPALSSSQDEDHAVSNVQSSSDESVVPLRSAKKRQKDGGFMSSASSMKTRGQKQFDTSAPTQTSTQSSATAMTSKLQIESDSSDPGEDDDMPTTLGIRKRSSQKAATTTAASSSPPVDSSSDDELEIVHVQKRSDHIALHDSSEDEDDEDVLTATPRRRKLKRSNPISQQERSDLNEDLDFLAPSSNDDEARQPRDSQSIRKLARMKALDALRRKRSGQAVVEELEDGGNNDVNSDEDEEVEEHNQQEDDTFEPADEPVPTSSRSMFQADDEDEDFLDDDANDDVLGVPEALPIQFSKFAAAKPRELFQHAVEWMVHKKINPAFGHSADVYDLTFKKLNDEVSGLVRSKFSSSAWTSDFVTSLNSRPAIAVQEHSSTLNSDFTIDHCDACNRSNHPATYEIQFQGKPYHLDTLDEVEHKDDDDDDGDDDDESTSQNSSNSDEKPSYDAQGRKVPPESKVYHVGRFCAANAETAHELKHWKLNLYDWVVKWIEDSGYSTPAKVVERDRWSNKKKRKLADKISDLMAEQGVTKKLWREFEDTINRARESKQSRF